jgi:hypothetical protein
MMISIVVLNFRVNASALAEVIMQFERKVGPLYAGNNGEHPISL